MSQNAINQGEIMNSYLFLDVDGVLNPMARRATKLDSTFLSHNIGQYRVWISVRQAEWLQGLLEQNVTIVWATTWVENESMLAELSTVLGLPLDLPRIYGLDYTDRANCGKQDGVERWLNEHGVDPRTTPCVWVDDLLGDGDRQWAWDVNIHPVTVNDRVGISDRRVIASIEAGLGLGVLV